MASEPLSQHEIDRLFDVAGEAAGIGGIDGSGTDVQVYDFRRPSRISKDRLRSLEAMYGLLARSLEGWLTGRIRSQVELELLEVQQFSFGEFLLSLPTPCASFVFEIADSGGQQGVIDFGHDFAFFVVDRLLGGSGPTWVPDRPLTPLERMMVRLVADRVAEQLTEIWQDHVRLDLTLSRFESIPDMLNVANREDPVLVASLEVHAADIRSPLLLCLPFSVLEKFFTSGTSQRIYGPRASDRDREIDRAAIESSLRQVHLPVRARLPRFPLAMRELASLQPGSVMLTGHTTDTEVEVHIGSERSYYAEIRRVGRKLAVRITRTLLPDAADTDHPDDGGTDA
jgi:flagellar motor switch protein FliM